MNKLKKKTMLLSLALAAGLLLPMVASAQTGGGVFYRGGQTESTSNNGVMSRGATGGYNLNNQNFGSNGYELHNQTFGQETTPLGGGLLILVAAGAGYALKKRKNNNKK
jgi:hypothetical protein